jgi:hypothetical protein
MAIPSVITDLSATAASNYPAGSDAPSVLDDVQRVHASFIRELYDQLFGVAQTVQDVTATRALSTTYTNSTDRPIFVQATLNCTVAGNAVGIVDGVTMFANYATVSQFLSVPLVVPPGSTYSIAPSGATLSIFAWNEIR